MKFKKITVGFVIQTFETLDDNENVCIHQEFIAGDQVDYEDMEGDTINTVVVPLYRYQPFNMTLE